MGNRNGTLLVPNRRGMPVMPDEAEWIVKRILINRDGLSPRVTADATSASLRGERIIKRCAADVWRGTLVVPADSPWIIKRWVADLTSRSLQTAEPGINDPPPGYAQDPPVEANLTKNRLIFKRRFAQNTQDRHCLESFLI